MFAISPKKPLQCIASVFFLIVCPAVIYAGSPGIAPAGHGVIVHSDTGVAQIDVCSDGVIHVRAGASTLPDKNPVPAVIRACAGGSFTSTSDNAAFHLTTQKLRVDIDRATGALHFLTLTGENILSEDPRNWQTPPLTGEADSGRTVQQQFQLSPGEALYGLGQHQEGFFDLRDIPIRLLQANTNIAIPFLISTKGYGLLWNNAALTDFNPTGQTVDLDPSGAGTFQTGPDGEYGFLLSGNLRGKLRLSVNEHPIIDIRNMWVPESVGARIHLAANTTYRLVAETGGNTRLAVRSPSDAMAFRSDTGQGVDYYFFYGPTPSQIVAAYREFTGAAPLLPRWVYGYWQCRERYSSQQQILDTAAEFRQRQIPVDVLVQDWQYWGKYGWNAMRFDEHDYPDPAQMMSALHRENFHMVISVWAKVGAETAVKQDLEKAHLLLTSPASTAEPGEAKETESWIDLFNPKAQRAFWADINRNLFSAGLDGWWLDASEPEGDPLKNDDTFLGQGKTLRNAFPLFETSAVYEGQRAAAPDKRVVILSRSAFTGQQRNGSISWSGDISANWETLRRQIPAGLSFAMSGFPYWTTDIGGFFRPVDQYTSADYHELLIRWFQFGAFCPIFRIHGYRSETEMWKYGAEAEKILTQYDELRYRLLPYIYSAAWGVTSRGEILMKALPFVYPKDRSLRDITDQFLFGDSLLVNPVTEQAATSRSVVLPAGDDWIDFWTGQTLHGGQTITTDAPLDRIPILVKAGSILPMGPVVQSASEPEDPLEIRIYSGKDADFTLYEDNGDGYAYEHGASTTIHLHWDNARKLLSVGDRSGTFPGMRVARTFRLVMVKPQHGVGVVMDSPADRTVTYEGHQIRVDLRKAS
jgi:alpha-D-xyloside xylohydrolase